MRKEDKPFRGTEVGTLIESLRSDFSIIIEEVRALRVDVDDLKGLKSEFKILRDDMILVKDTLRIFARRLTGIESTLQTELPQINSRLSLLETKPF